ncbi:hypothetical protein G1H11_11265 [Phytoactinopolyspora alkaliphila]|uniref:Fibronectin type-III domain-containing protein n=1 Tax=Phytoactinopolyspora alkaliphila TaxID=1783498 RepID=A0A6N9YLT9_9ACTN|nr:fibronectin type III domain-containing protein [Phytoactinopolyspora alkaliphila]NED95890.1 hypothetical protein [Phytoactinopolyspora alkaliphila]
MTNPSGAADAVILVDDAGTVTLFIGAAAEPRAEATTNAEVIRILLEYAAHLGRPITAATHYPSGHRSLHKFEPDGTVTRVELTMGRRTGGPFMPDSFPTVDGSDPAPARAVVPARQKPRAAVARSGLVGAAAVSIAVLALTSSDRPGTAVTDEYHDQVISSEVDTGPLEIPRPVTDSPQPPTSTPLLPTPEPSTTATSTPDPTESATPTSSPTSEPTSAPTTAPPPGGGTDNTTDDEPPPREPEPPAPPTTPGGLSVAERTGSSLTVSWRASAAELGVTGYAVYVDGVRTDTVGGTSTTIGGLRNAVSYVISVAAIDAGGNVSAQASITATTLDTQAPSAPSGVDISDRSGSSLTASWGAASDNVGVTGYVVYLDGTRVKTVNGTSATVGGLDPATSYQVSVMAVDAAGNTSGRASAKGTTLDTVRPTRPGNLTGRSSIRQVVLDWSSSTDNVGVTGYAVYVDGRRVTTTSGTGATVSGLRGATDYTISVSAYDAAGNLSPSAVLEIKTKAEI